MTDHSNIESLIQSADALVAEGNWGEAREVYKEAVSQDPNNIEIRERVLNAAKKFFDFQVVINQDMDLAELFVSGGNVERAIESYKDILNLEKYAQSNNIRGAKLSEIQTLVAQAKPEIFAKTGVIYLNEGRYKDAIKWLRPSLDLDPSRWDTHMAMGRALMMDNKNKEAISEFQEVVRLANNEAASAYELLGEVFLRIGRSPQKTVMWFRNAGELFVQRHELTDAIRAYERILEFEPRNKDILVRLGDIYAEEGYDDKACSVYFTLAQICEEDGLSDKVIGYLEKTLEFNPDHEEARTKLIDVYNAALEKDSSNINVRNRLIDCLFRRGMYAEVAEHQMFLANIYIEKGNIDAAIDILRKLIEIEPKHIEARRLLGDQYRRKDMRTEALAEYQEVVSLYHLQGSDEEAINFQRQLVEMFPETSDLRYQVALTLRSQGNHQGAVAELQRLIDSDRNDIVALNYLAEEYASLGEWSEAENVYRRILGLDPGRSDVRKRLIKYYLDSGNYAAAKEEAEALPNEDFEKKAFSYKIIERCLEDNKTAEAESYINDLDENDERLVSFRKELVKRYLDLGDLEQADRTVVLVPRSDKERNKLVTGLLELYLNSSNMEKAVELIDRLPGDDSLRISFQHRLISSYQDKGRFEEAAKEMAKLSADDDSLHDFVLSQITGLMEAGRLDEAMENVKCLPEEDPVKNSFIGKLIEAYLQGGDIDKATEEVERLSVNSEISSRYKRRIIQAYLNNNRFEEAERDIMELDSEDPEKISFLRILLQKYEINGLFDRIREIVVKLPDNMPEKQQYLDGIVHSFFTSGNMNKARQEVYNMAESVSAAGNHSEAEHLYYDLLAYHPVDVEIRMRLCHEMAAQGKIDRAREGLLVLAGRFIREGNATSSADIFTRILEIEPNNLNARYRLGEIWSQHGQTAQALEQFSFLAREYLRQNLNEVAQKVILKILELDPKDIAHRRQLIKLLARNMRVEEATEHYRILLSIHLDRGELEEALTCVREVRSLQPLNLELSQRLGSMFLKAGFLEEGQQLMEELIPAYKGRGDHGNVVRVFRILSDAFNANQQWEAALEYLERIGDEHVEADEWSEAQDNYLEALEEYLKRGRREYTDALFVKLTDGFFRHKNVNEGLSLLEAMEGRFKDSGRLDLALVIKDRLVSMLERLEEWSRALEVVVTIAESNIAAGDVEQAIVYYRRSVDLAINHQMRERGIELAFKLASLMLEYHGVESAKKVFEEIRSYSGSTPDTVERLANMLFEHEFIKEACPMYEEVLGLDPERSLSLARISIIYALEGNLDQVVGLSRQIFVKGMLGYVTEEYSKALGMRPNDAAYHIKMGEFFKQLGFLEEAIDEFNKAISDPAKVLVAVNGLSVAFQEKGYRDLAVKQLQKAMEQPGFSDEELLDLRYNLAVMLEEDGRYEEAIQAYQECYAVDICFRDVGDRMVSLFEKVGDSGQSDDLSYEYGVDFDDFYDGEEQG